jgi:serine/threonine protein phosphatase 1
MPMTAPTLPAGLRLYAIGDVHGCLDVLKQLLEKVAADSLKAKGKVRIIFLGDYVDRGLHSKGVIDYLLEWRKHQKESPIFLLGNHEEVMRSILIDREKELLDNWLSFGGRETLMSYGVKPSALAAGPTKMIAELAAKTPPSHLEFLQKLEVSASFGDYFFCHAGVRPGVSLDQQKDDDLIWIRQEFLGYTGPFGKVVVHGHSIRLKAEFKANRIAIDTGAYATGRLTALGLEGTEKWIIQTG